MNTFADLFAYLQLTTFTHISEFLSDNWEGKEKQESLFRLFANLHLVPEFRGYHVCDNNFNLQTLKNCTSIVPFMSKSLNDKGDKSDLTLSHSVNKELIVCTSKNLNTYGVGDLDVRDLRNLFDLHYKPHGYNMRLCVIVRNKSALLTKIHNAEQCNNDIIEVLKASNTLLFDWDDLQSLYVSFKMNFSDLSIDSLDVLLYNNHKIPLTLRMHQDYAIQRTLQLLQDNNNILWGQIPRSGKSYIMAGLIAQCLKTMDNFLIITTSPNETIAMYNEVFAQHIQFQGVSIINLNGSNKKPKLGAKNIIIASKQFLQSKGVSSEKTKQITWLKNLKIDLRFIDESHNGGTTELMQSTLTVYGGQCNTIYITATYLKPVNTYSISNDAWILWDLEDVKLCQTIDEQSSQQRLNAKHNGIIDFVHKHGTEHIKAKYSIYPELHFMTTSFLPGVKEEMKSFISDDPEMGWSLESLFLLKNNGKEYELEFQNTQQMLRFCKMVFGVSKTSQSGRFTIPDYDCILQRIKTICDNPKYNSRTFTTSNPLSILAFLPCGKIPIELVSEAFKKFLEDNNIIPDFEILTINSKVNGGDTAVSRIDDAMQKVKLTGKKGLLILAGRQCSMGVTLKHCDVVLLLNSCSSFDMLYQMMFRCMSEDTGKKCGFVVDINVQRVVDTLIDYALKINPKKSAKEAVRYILDQRLVNLNNDEWMGEYFGCKGLNIESLVGKVYDIWTAKPSNAIKRVLDVLQFKFDLFNKDDQSLFNKLFNTSKVKTSVEIKEIVDELCINDDKDDDLNKGIKETPLEQDAKSINSTTERETTKNEEKPQKDVNFIRDILRHLIPLVCLLSIHSSTRNTFEEMCLCIAEDERLKTIFMEQIRVWWNKSIPDDVFNVFIKMYNKYLKDNTDINQVIMRVKELFSRSLHNQRELAKLIDEYLIPHELERKLNAEVSTPPQLRKDMLDALEAHVANFFKTPKKVLEPCCGKGQFVIDIIDRFMYGLKEMIVDEKERYKIIVEECIYFADINATNIFIVRLLLDPLGVYNLNWFEGDTLKLDVRQHWNVEHFNAVIGNPPYQEEFKNLKLGGPARPLYHIFTTMAINMSQYVLFIIPSRWMAGGLGLGSFRKEMLSCNKIRFIQKIAQKQADKDFGNSVEIKGGVNYFLYDNEYNGNCLFNGVSTRLDTFDILIEPEWVPIVNKVISIMSQSLMNVCKGSSYWNIKSNDSRLEKEFKDGTLTCYVNKASGLRKYISKEHVSKDASKWKVITTEAYNSGDNFGSIYVIEPYEICNQTYLMFELENKEQANNLASLLDTCLIRFMLKVRKISQHIKPDTMRWCPLLSLERAYNDLDVFQMFGLTDVEIEYVTKSIKKTTVVYK